MNYPGQQRSFVLHCLHTLRWTFLALMVTTLLSPALAAGASFTVGNIEVHGLQRISTGTVYTYLPISVGDKVDAQRVSNAVRALYKTGFFSNVQMRRSGDTLIVDVRERPSIASFKIKGNKKLKTKDLVKPLKKIGLARGRVFSHSVLKKVKQQLSQLYISHAKYNATVDTDVKHIGNNRVDVTINISEGVNTTIKAINIVGNKTFDDSTLLNQFKLETTHWYSFLGGNNKYLSETLSGDLESLRSYYMDRGYADFRIKSVQVTISPDYKHVFITINVHEGDIYKIAKVSLAGKFIVPKKKLEKLIQTRTGNTFSMGAAQDGADLITNLLGSKGYAFAKVQPVPRLHRKSHTVDLIYHVKPGHRAYVRRITFSGMPDTDSVVLRREMRQLEGSWLSNTGLKRSKFRIKRLPFVKTVKEKTKPVAGTPDMVDLNYELTPQQAGQFVFGVGYSAFYGVGLNASIEHVNFLGKGDTVQLGLHGNQVNKSYSASWTEPYATVNGVSRTISAYYDDGKALLWKASPIHTTRYGFSLLYGIPMSEFDRFHVGVSASHNELLTSIRGSSIDYIVFALDPNNGDTYTSPLGPAIKYREYRLIAGFSHNSMNRAMFATRGTEQRISLTTALPFSNVKYYSLSLSSTDILPLGLGFLYLFDGHAGLNKTYSDSRMVPPTQRFFVGGPSTVRGYKSGYLGPLDIYGNPLGGDFEFYSQNELIIPPLFGGEDAQKKTSARFSLFFDVGRAFRKVTDFGFDKLYKSAGLSMQFLAPVGLMRISIGWPIGSVQSDKTEIFQFTVGRHF